MSEQQKDHGHEDRQRQTYQGKAGPSAAAGMASEERGAMHEEALRQSVEAQPRSEDMEQRTKQAREEAAQRAAQAREEAAKRLDTGVVAAGQRMESLASTLRERSGTANTPAVGQAADLLERSGRYLQQSGVEGVRSDLQTYIRENPFRSVLLAAAGGFVFSRTFGGKRRTR